MGLKNKIFDQYIDGWLDFYFYDDSKGEERVKSYLKMRKVYDFVSVVNS